MKRWTRPASSIGATSTRPSSTRQAFAVVPPMSNEITSFLPASAPNRAVASPPPAGPIQQADQEGSAVSGDTSPPAECISRRAPKAAGGEFELEALQITVHERLDIGIGAGGDAALVFP